MKFYSTLKTECIFKCTYFVSGIVLRIMNYSCKHVTMPMSRVEIVTKVCHWEIVVGKLSHLLNRKTA